MKKICFFLPNLQVGGAEKVICHIANLLVKSSYKIDIVAVNDFNNSISEINEKIRIINLSSKKTIFSFFKFLRYVYREKPDVVISTFNNTSCISSIIKLIFYRKLRLIIRKPISPLYNLGIIDSLYKLFNPFVHSVANHIVVPSSEMYKDLHKARVFYKRKLVFIPNPLNQANIISLSKKKEVNFITGPYIIMVARLEKQKDFNTIIHAYAKVKEKIDIKMLILGEGSLRNSLEKKIKFLGLEKNILLPGFVKNPYYYIKNSEVFILSSFAEGSPNSLQQAICLKKKIVATDCKYGPRELLMNGKLGYLTPIGNIELISESIIKMLRCNDNIVLSEEYLNNYSDDFILYKYMNLFDE